MGKLAILAEVDERLNNPIYREKILAIKDDVFPILQKEWEAVDTSINLYLDQEKYRRIQEKYPETKFVNDIVSEEAWKITENVRKMLVRLKNFFVRIFQYIKVFVIQRIAAAQKTIAAWAQICNEQQESAMNYIQSYEPKLVSVDAIGQLFVKGGALFVSMSNRVDHIKNITQNTVESNNNAEKLSPEQADASPEMREYNEALKAVNTENGVSDTEPNGNGKPGAQPTKTAVDGGWADTSKLSNLASACGTMVEKLKAMNKLQMTVNNLISDLGHEDNAPTEAKTDNNTGKQQSDMNEGLNKQKLQMLQKFSKECLNKVIGDMTKWISYAAEQCKQFTKKYDKAGQQSTSVKQST